jgi:glycosyltransferase involved in cell wall biosynthesis
MKNVESLNVVICTYNRIDRLTRVISSLLAARIPAGVQVEILVVDNNSSDATRERVEALSLQKNPSVRYLFEERQGKSHALNKAIKHLSGEMIAFTDDDVVVDPGYLVGIVEAGNKFPDYECFGGKVVALYPDIMPNWLDLEGSMSFLKSPFVDRQDGDDEVPYSEETNYSTPGGCNMFFRRSAIVANGDFRTDLGPVGRRLGFAEDVEYCYRLRDSGYGFYYIPSVIVQHPVYPERLTKSYLLSWQFNCGRSDAKRQAGSGNSIAIFGVPRYLFRRAITHLVGWIVSTKPQPTFFHRLRLAYTWGEIVGHATRMK